MHTLKFIYQNKVGFSELMTVVKAGAVVIWGHATSYRVCHDSRLPL